MIHLQAPPQASGKRQRVCVIDSGSIEDGDGGDGAYDLLDLRGTPEEIGKHIGDCLSEIDLACGGESTFEEGRDLFLSVRIRITDPARNAVMPAPPAGHHWCADGPWLTETEARNFAEAEVGALWRIAEVDGRFAIAIADDGRLRLTLASRGNPDLGQDPSQSMPGTEDHSVFCDSLAEAAQLVRNWITTNNLGAGNWFGGCVVEVKTGNHLARVSYNGKLWDNQDREIADVHRLCQGMRTHVVDGRIV